MSGIDSVFAATREGLASERARLEAAAYDIAIANTPLAPGQTLAVRPLSAGGSFSQALGPTASQAPDKSVYDPSSPMANAQGMVRYPNVNLVEAMTTLIAADRGYEANIRAFNALRSMQLDALSIGSGA